MSDNNEQSQSYPQPPAPNPDLAELDRLVGTWRVSGEAQGQVTFEWMEGGFFLLQHVDLKQNGYETKGLEIIGHEQPFMEPAGEAIKSRYYDSNGSTLDYVYEIDDDTLIIWAGEKGSPAYYKGRFSADGDRLMGSWVYPDGGGYTSTSTRVK